METAVLGAGCFWCVEAVFKEVRGVVSVTPGFCNGRTRNPTYKEVCTGTTGHNEVARIDFDPAVVSFGNLLEVFWGTHDPTTLNRQGEDVGEQYRSGVYYLNEAQRTTAEAMKQALDASGAFDAPIVTEVVPLDEFFPAENYHHDYYAHNPDQGYCRLVIRPKLEKFRKVFASMR